MTVEELARIMEDLIYERGFGINQDIQSKETKLDYKHKLSYYPRSIDGKSPEYWLWYYETFIGDPVGVIYCDKFDSVEDMAYVMKEMYERNKYNKNKNKNKK